MVLQETDLRAADLLGDIVECLDDTESEFLTLLVLCHGDIFNVTDLAYSFVPLR